MALERLRVCFKTLSYFLRAAPPAPSLACCLVLMAGLPAEPAQQDPYGSQMVSRSEAMPPQMPVGAMCPLKDFVPVASSTWGVRDFGAFALTSSPAEATALQ